MRASTSGLVIWIVTSVSMFIISWSLSRELGPCHAVKSPLENSARHESEKDSHSAFMRRGSRILPFDFSELADPRNSKARQWRAVQSGVNRGNLVLSQTEFPRNQRPSQAEKTHFRQRVFLRRFSAPPRGLSTILMENLYAELQFCPCDRLRRPAQKP